MSIVLALSAAALSCGSALESHAPARSGVTALGLGW